MTRDSDGPAIIGQKPVPARNLGRILNPLAKARRLNSGISSAKRAGTAPSPEGATSADAAAGACLTGLVIRQDIIRRFAKINDKNNDLLCNSR